MKAISDFAKLFGGKLELQEDLVLRKGEKYYLLNIEMKKLVRGNFFSAGAYLGKVEKGKFYPSFFLLSMIHDRAENKVIVDDKTAWLFICGRDVFRKGVMKAMGSNQKGDYTLILNKHDELLGYGIILENHRVTSRRLVIRNVLDIGDFLRRENNA